jgi:hypothetical protein
MWCVMGCVMGCVMWCSSVVVYLSQYCTRGIIIVRMVREEGEWSGEEGIREE